MPTPDTLNGHLVGPHSVELDEPVQNLQGEVEVKLRLRAGNSGGSGESVFEFLRRLPPGRRSRENIDRQIRQERDAWGEKVSIRYTEAER